MSRVASSGISAHTTATARALNRACLGAARADLIPVVVSRFLPLGDCQRPGRELPASPGEGSPTSPGSNSPTRDFGKDTRVERDRLTLDDPACRGRAPEAAGQEPGTVGPSAPAGIARPLHARLVPGRS